MTIIRTSLGEIAPVRHLPGFVYVLAARHGGVKIGASVNPPSREAHANRGKTIEAKLVYQRGFPDYMASEQHAHQRLAKYLLAHEWFSCPVDYAIDVVKSLPERRR